MKLLLLNIVVASTIGVLLYAMVKIIASIVGVGRFMSERIVFDE